MKGKKILLDQGSKDWLEFRKDKIGASDAPVIMELSPWSTPYQLYQEKKKLVKEKTANFAMQRGTLLESEARVKVNAELKTHFIPCVYTHREYEYLMASLDGVDFKESHILEIKCPNPATHSMAVKGIIPDHYYCQMQHAMMVSGISEGIYASYDGRDIAIVETALNPDYVQNMIQKELEFYQCLKNNTPPPSKESDHVVVQMQNPDIFFQWKQASESLKELENTEKSLRSQLIDLGDDGNIILSYEDILLCKMTRVNRKGSVDWVSLCKDLKIEDSIVKKYQKEQISYYCIKALE